MMSKAIPPSISSPAVSTNNKEALRGAFERWAKGTEVAIGLVRDGDSYYSREVHNMYCAFQTAHKLAWGTQQVEITSLTKDVSTLQCAIDRLMLEFCPDEMTAEQMRDWGNSQSRYGESL